jgi:RNA polymerase sigma factor (sigma-70 family)
METVSRAPAAPPDPVGRGVRLPLGSDELLARQAARGSERAFAVLYERYHQPLYRYCRSILRNDVDAQDALQSTFAGALSALQRGQRNAPLRPWLFRIAHNEAIGVIRRRTRDSAQKFPDEPRQAVASAEEEAGERARWASLVADLAELPERARAALLLRELSGLSHQEIAIALGTTVGGAKQAIFEARQALFELSEGRAMRCEDVRRRLSAGDGRVLRGRGVRAHLRDCAACEQFAAGIRDRREELRAFAPVLAPAASAALLARALHAAAGHGGGVVASSAVGASAASSPVATSAAAGAVGKAAGAAVASKALVVAAVVATAGVGVAGVSTLASSDHASSRVLRTHSPAGSGTHSSQAAAVGAGLSSAVSGVRTRNGAVHASARGSQHAKAVAAGHSSLHHSAAVAGGSRGHSSSAHSRSSSHARSGAGSKSASSRGASTPARSSVRKQRATKRARRTHKRSPLPTRRASNTGGLTVALPVTSTSPRSIHSGGR